MASTQRRVLDTMAPRATQGAVRNVLAGASFRPWQGGQLRQFFLFQVVALTLLLIGWFGAAGQVHFADQILFVNLGGAGLILAGLANLVWLLAGRRAVFERLVTLERRGLSSGGLDQRVGSNLAEADTRQVIVADAPTVTRIHIPSCPLIVGKPVTEVEDGGHFVPCEVCH